MPKLEKGQRPVHADDPITLFVATGGEQMLRVVIWIILAVLLGTNGLNYAQFGKAANAIIFMPFLLVVLSSLWLLSRQRFHSAFRLFLWGMMLAGLASAFNVAGFQSPALLFVPITVMLSAWLLPRREVVLMFVISALVYCALALLHSAGALPAETRSPFFWGATFTAITLICSLLGLTMTAGVRSQYRRAVSLSDDLAELNRDLESKVTERTAELEAALQRLRQTQDDLIQSEKLASLGSMVAGISHELNTPIGNAVTVSSTLFERTQMLLTQFEAGSLKKSELAQGLVAANEMAALINRSVNRSAALVTSFKQVAVDQVSERRRQFDVYRLVEENLEALRPGLKNKPWVIRNQVPEGILCDSFPGPLGQVLTNLIQNAIMHGFSGRDDGHIDIAAHLTDDMLELTVADDGAGMDAATSVHVFDPFFTTKLGQGGSGLGMAICYRIVSTILAGDIHVQSSPGTGTRFVVRMPVCTPGKI